MNKTCSSCKEDKLLRYFSYRADTNKYRDQCKKCHKGYNKDRVDTQTNVLTLFSQGLKQCGRCKKVKPLLEYNNDKQTTTGKTSLCKCCIKTKYTPDELRNFSYKKKYNITLKEYNTLYYSLNGECEICKNYNNKLVVDHDHKTGKVRGLLCTTCNFGLGFFKDNKQYLEDSIHYLNKLNQYSL